VRIFGVNDEAALNDTRLKLNILLISSAHLKLAHLRIQNLSLHK